jgi:hypothetical protein
MATGQTLLDTMELINAELQLQGGEVDVTRGLLALNHAQDYFEALGAKRGIKGGTIGTVVTAASTESTAFPTGLLRLDKLQFIDSTTNRPVYDLIDLKKTGAHASSNYFPWTLISQAATGTGQVGGYWTNGRNIYWAPVPAGVYTIRWYGFQQAADITASGTFLYDDIVMLPLASFACQILKTGLDDDAGAMANLAGVTFKSVLDTLETFNRDGAMPFTYTERHTT